MKLYLPPMTLPVEVIPTAAMSLPIEVPNIYLLKLSTA